MAGDLELVPDNFTIASFNHAFSEKSLSKGLIYFQEGYIHNVTINKNKDNTVIISARCFRSMRKGETPVGLIYALIILNIHVNVCILHFQTSVNWVTTPMMKNTHTHAT